MITAAGEPSGRQSRLSREAVRLVIALVLLLGGAASSAMTGPPPDDSGRVPAQQLTQRSRLLRGGSPQTSPSLDSAADQLVARPLWTVDREPAVLAYHASTDLGSLIRRAHLASNGWREAEDALRAQQDRQERVPSIVPAVGYISSGFTRARAHPVLDTVRPHRGIDVVAPYGSPILSTAKGRVSFVGRSAGYGLTIEVDHGGGMTTRYAHASRALVRRDQLVGRGDTIAQVGNSGLAVGAHVHYEVLVNGEPRNPRRYIFNPNVVAD